MSKAAFIGLGAMGSRMAANLLKAGHEGTVCDLAPDAVKRLADAGAKTAVSARKAAEGTILSSRWFVMMKFTAKSGWMQQPAHCQA